MKSRTISIRNCAIIRKSLLSTRPVRSKSNNCRSSRIVCRFPTSSSLPRGASSRPVSRGAISRTRLWPSKIAYLRYQMLLKPQKSPWEAVSVPESSNSRFKTHPPLLRTPSVEARQEGKSRSFQRTCRTRFCLPQRSMS